MDPSHPYTRTWKGENNLKRFIVSFLKASQILSDTRAAQETAFTTFFCFTVTKCLIGTAPGEKGVFQLMISEGCSSLWSGWWNSAWLCQWLVTWNRWGHSMGQARSRHDLQKPTPSYLLPPARPQLLNQAGNMYSKHGSVCGRQIQTPTLWKMRARKQRGEIWTGGLGSQLGTQDGVASLEKLEQWELPVATVCCNDTHHSALQWEFAGSNTLGSAMLSFKEAWDEVQ